MSKRAADSPMDNSVKIVEVLQWQWWPETNEE